MSQWARWANDCAQYQSPGPSLPKMSAPIINVANSTWSFQAQVKMTMVKGVYWYECLILKAVFFFQVNKGKWWDLCREFSNNSIQNVYCVRKKKTGISAVWILVLHTWALSVQNCVHSNYFVHVQWKKKLKNTWRPHHAPDLALTSGTKVLWVAKWGLHGG